MKRETWKQATPIDQLIAINSSAEGWLSNLQDGISTSEKVLPILADHFEQVKELIPYLIRGEWEKQP